MLRSIHLLLITMLLTLSAQAEIRTSLPDFSKAVTTALAPLEAELAWTTPTVAKTKYIDEKLLEPALASSCDFISLPFIAPFQKASFNRQSRSYSSRTIQRFHLRI